MTDANRNQLWARVLVDEFVRSGVEHAVVAPGSRSTPLVLAAHADPDLRVHVCLDERSAAFFALGLGRASGSPALVVTTSGTAVANLLPAAVEADRAEVPLLLVTADRPRELRDADANQSVTQPGIFATCARAEWDLMHPEITDTALRHLRSVACRAVAAARGPGGGPVHLNVPLRKPLEPTLVEADRAAIEGLDPLVKHGRPAARGGRGAAWTSVRREAGVSQDTVDVVLEAFRGASRPLLVAGHLPSASRGERPSELLSLLSLLPTPILVDPLSGMRLCEGHGVVRSARYDTFLRDPVVAASLRPDLVIQLGRTPTSAVLQLWLSECDDRYVIGAGPLWKDHMATARGVFDADPLSFARLLGRVLASESDATPWRVEPGWGPSWQAVEAAVDREFDAGASLESAELRVAQAVARATPDGVPIFVSSSMPIRDIDTAVGGDERRVPLLGNRGASGIDGIVSSAVGVALGISGSATPKGVCLIGDLAFLHDANGLMLVGDADVVFVVVNNDGGGIFGALPIAEWDPPFTELFATPHGRDLAAYSAAFGLPHEVVEADSVGDALESALASTGPRVLEVRTDRGAEREARTRDLERARAAARRVLEGMTN